MLAPAPYKFGMRALIALLAAVAIIAGSIINSKNEEIAQLQVSLNSMAGDLHAIRAQMTVELLKKSQAEQDARLAVSEFQKSMQRDRLPDIGK